MRRLTGRKLQFANQLKQTLEYHTKSKQMVVTSEPDRIQYDLAKLGAKTEYKPIYEGLKGIALNDSRRKEGYEPKIVGYEFTLIP